MTTQRMRVGLLGAGYILQAHAKALQALPDVEITAVCDVSRGRAEAAAASFGIPGVFTSLDEMLKSGIDAVHVLVPPQLHIDVTRQILEAGVNAFVEKPMGLDAAACASLADLAAAKGVKLGVNHNFLFLSSYERLRTQVKDGTIGRLDHVALRWLYPLGLIQFGPYNNWMLRAEANLFYELGPHLVAFLIDLVGPLDELQARASLPIEVAEGALDDAAAVGRALQGIEVVYHLAKAVGQRWQDYVDNDQKPTRVLAEAALAAGVKRFIYTGTIDSYDAASPSTVINGSTPLDPAIASRNLYARSKAACEALLLEMHRSKGLPLVIFRPAVVIGEGCPPAHWGVGMFHSDTRVQYWGDGQNKLPLVLVDDVADALVLGLDKPGIEGQSFLLTDDPLLSAREYVEAVSTLTQTKLRATPTPIWKFFVLDVAKELVKNAIRHPNRKTPSHHDWACRQLAARFDNSRSRQVLGWQPVGTREGLIERGVAASVRHYLR